MLVIDAWPFFLTVSPHSKVLMPFLKGIIFPGETRRPNIVETVDSQVLRPTH